MLATNGPRWYGQQPESNWSSFGVSIAITIGIFIAAVASMRTVSTWLEPRAVEREIPTIVELQPPIAVPKPAAKPRPVVRPEPVAPTVAAPTTVPTTIDIAPPITVPTTIAPVTSPGDTSRAKSTGPAIPLGPVGVKDGTNAPMSRAPVAAGVTREMALPPLSAKARDSIMAHGVMADAANWMSDKYKPKGAEAAALDESRRIAEQMMRRPTSGTQPVHVAVGKGMYGEGAVSGGKTGYHDGMVSIPFPLFSPGPSPAERKRREKLLAEYQGYLKRMELRMMTHADSVLADSLRRDSIDKARPRIVP